MKFSYSRPHSISSSHCSSTKSSSSIWSKISNLFHHSRSCKHSSEFSQADNYSNSTLSATSVKTADLDHHTSQRRHRKQLVNNDVASPPMLPPFSPTYCKTNEFPYSNFYVKLPDGRWMVRYRDGNRDILRTDIMEGYLI